MRPNNVAVLEYKHAYGPHHGQIAESDYRLVFRIPLYELTAKTDAEVISYLLTESRSPGWHAQSRAPIKHGDIILIPREEQAEGVGKAWMVCRSSPHLPRHSLMFEQWPSCAARLVDINLKEFTI